MDLSVYARGHEGRSLVEFADNQNLSGNWANHTPALSVMLSGSVFDNLNGNLVMVENRLNQEYLVHINGPNGSCVVNLANILSCAAEYCKQQQKLSADAMADMQRRRNYDETSSPNRDSCLDR